jgi:hyaluronate lyase
LNAFADAYGATVDSYRLPGVTADVTHNKLPPNPASIGPRAQGQSTLSPYGWVGGATLGKFGAAGMWFKGVGVTLTGKKSWFMFDDEIVCLGTGITSTDNRPIETTVENRKLNTKGSNAFTVNGTVKSNSPGWTETMNSVTSAHLAGTASGADIGYYFPQPATIKAVREARTGSWSDIDSEGSTDPITRNYLRMGFEHGSNPSNATYQYVLLPGRKATSVANYAAQPQITVIANNANVQAVSEITLGITAANFWSDTERTAGVITADKKSCVLIQNDGTFLDVAVSDPTQANPGSINLQIAMNGGVLVNADGGVSVTQTSPTVMLSVDVNGSAGRTFHARFYLGSPAITSISAQADSYVYDAAGSENSNYGTNSTLAVKKASTGYNRESYLRFDVPAYSGALIGAYLQLMPLSTSTPGVHGIARVEDNSWIESGAGGITWNNRPSSTGGTLATWTPAVGVPIEANVSSAIPTSGQASFRVYGTTQTSDGLVSYGSREHATAANKPKLTLFTGPVPPVVAIETPTDGDFFPQAGTITITAQAQAPEGSITSVAFYDGATLLGTDTTPPYSINAGLAGGFHDLSAMATASNGLSKTSLTRRIEIAFPPTALAGNASTPPDTAVDVDLSLLVSDVETPLSKLRFNLGSASNGSVMLLPDGHTARFTPPPGYSGPANFGYTVSDTATDARTLFNYDFQASSSSDISGNGRDGALNVQGTGAAGFTGNVPQALAPQHTLSLQLTENGTPGAARVERVLTIGDVDLANEDWTVAGWFKRSVANNIDVIMQLGASGGYSSDAMTLAFYSSSSTLELRNYNGAALDIGLSKTGVTTGVWHHFAVVRGGSKLSWYHNGVLVGTDSAFGFSFDNSSPVKFGGPSATSVLDRWLNGSLTDLAVFNAALNGTEISELMTRPVAYLAGQTTASTVNVNVLFPFDSWRLLHFGTTANTGLYADTADKDNDGLSNLLEYACATNPNTNNAQPHSTALSSSNIEYIYTRNKAATDVVFAVEWSDTPTGPWNTSGVTSMILSDNGTRQQIKATLSAGTNGRRFVRLRVTN